MLCEERNQKKTLLSLKVESEDTYQRIGGTSTGGGTFWGLGSLLTKAKVNIRDTW